MESNNRLEQEGSSSSQQDQQDANDESSVGAAEWEIQRDLFKARGDDSFRSKDYGTAIRNYTSAIDLDDSNVVLYSNRSAAYLANNEKSKALYDAQKCIALDATFVKGFSRYAAALSSLGRYTDALVQYQKMLDLEPENKVALEGVKTSRSRIQQQQAKQKELERIVLEQMKGSSEENTNEKISQQENDAKNLDSNEQINGMKKEREAKESPKNEDDNILDDFFDEVEEAATKPKARSETESEKTESSNAPSKFKASLSELGSPEEQMTRLLKDNYKWRNLNPFWVLAIPDPENTPWELVQKRYKVLSLMLHPDKHVSSNTERAREAFEQVRTAMKSLEDEQKRTHVLDLIAAARKSAKREWNRLSSRGSTEGEDYKDFENKAIMKVFADIEMKRRDVERRKKEYEKRQQQQEQEQLDKEKQERAFDKSWKETKRVDKRVGNWREFQTKKAKR